MGAAVEADAQRTLAEGIQKEIEAFQCAGIAGFDFDRQHLGAGRDEEIHFRLAVEFFPE